MIVDVPNNKKAKLIGDPHLGRRFETGVPLHRRGEREKKQWQNFEDQLNTPDVDYVVMVGDLFDHPHVGHGVVVKAADYLLEAAANNPYKHFFFLAGNHDISRNTEAVGAWEAFSSMVSERQDNIHVIDTFYWFNEFMFFPWQWGVKAADQLAEATKSVHWEVMRTVAIGHWDLKSYGGSDDHLCPAAAIRKLGIEDIYSGHYHTAGTYTVDGVDVYCTGSMEPYSHGEDPEELIYVTRSLAAVLAEPEAYKDKHVRVVLKPGEELPELDCLALTALRDGSVEESREQAEVNIARFDWDAVLKRELADVDKDVVAFIEERLN